MSSHSPPTIRPAIDTSFDETSSDHNSSATTSTIDDDPLNFDPVLGGWVTLIPDNVNCDELKARYDEEMEEAKRAGQLPDGDKDYDSSSDIVFDDAASVHTVSTSTSIKDDTPAPVAWMCRSGMPPELYAQHEREIEEAARIASLPDELDEEMDVDSRPAILHSTIPFP